MNLMIFAPAEGASMNMVWNSMTPRNTLPMDARSTDAPPTSSAAMQNMPIWLWDEYVAMSPMFCR